MAGLSSQGAAPSRRTGTCPLLSASGCTARCHSPSRSSPLVPVGIAVVLATTLAPARAGAARMSDAAKHPVGDLAG